MPTINFDFEEVKISGSNENVSKTDFITYTNAYHETIEELSNQSSHETNFEFVEVIGYGYVAIVLILFLRFAFNIISLLKRSRHEKVSICGQSAILLNTKLAPHSFFNFLFISKYDYEVGSIDKEIIVHELAHIRQYHSIDILLTEIILIVFWFNPILYLYRKSIKLNHEFLADQYVLGTDCNQDEYSYKLINFASRKNSNLLVSGFDFSHIKKRIVMLPKYQEKKKFPSNLFLIMPIIAVIFIVTSFKEREKTEQRNPDALKWFTGTYSGYRINDSTFFCYGDYFVQSDSKKSKITAKRLKVSNEMSDNKNYFENDFLSGKVYKDGIDVFADVHYLDKLITFSADNITYEDDSFIVILEGNAKVRGEDVIIESEKINLHLNVWNPDNPLMDYNKYIKRKVE